MVTYTKTDIARILSTPDKKVTERTVQFYVASGLVEPQDRQRGKAFKFTEDEALEFCIAKVLMDDGHQVFFVQQVMHELRTGSAEIWRQGKRSIISLKDFFSSDEWGQSKELFLIGDGNKYELYAFPIISIEAEKYDSFESMNKIIARSVAPKKVKSLVLIVMSKVKGEAQKLLRR